MAEMYGGGSLVTLVKRSREVLLARVVGEVDLNNSPELRRELFAAIDALKPAKVVLNLAEVPYMDSSAVAVLVELLRRLGRGRKVCLTNLQPRVRGLLEIARLNTIFTLVDDEKDA